jgi:hypothetical protein
MIERLAPQDGGRKARVVARDIVCSAWYKSQFGLASMFAWLMEQGRRAPMPRKVEYVFVCLAAFVMGAALAFLLRPYISMRPHDAEAPIRCVGTDGLLPDGRIILLDGPCFDGFEQHIPPVAPSLPLQSGRSSPKTP